MNQDADNSSSVLPEPLTPANSMQAGQQDIAAAQAGLPAPSAAQPASHGAVAEDGDRIEPVWVVRVKQLLLATGADPFEQNRQMAALRAEYIKKRYNKDIQVGE